jgi:hypothetical protein
MPSITTVNGSVTPAIALSPVSDVKPEMSSGLNSWSACSETSFVACACAAQPSTGRLSSRILPLKVSGYGIADPPPAPWNPMVALWPLAFALSVLRYLTLIRPDPSWTCTCPLTLSPVLATRFSWKSTMNVRLGAVPTVP